MTGKTWYCKIGEADPFNVPEGGDAPMRDAISRAYQRITGEEPAFVFSGWGAQLTESERAVVENRLPDRSKVTREVPYDEPDQLRTIIGCFVAIHGTHVVPVELRELASSCAFRAVSGV